MSTQPNNTYVHCLNLTYADLAYFFLSRLEIDQVTNHTHSTPTPTLVSPSLTSCSSRVQIGDLCSATSHHCDVVHMTLHYEWSALFFSFPHRPKQWAGHWKFRRAFLMIRRRLDSYERSEATSPCTKVAPGLQSRYTRY